jgi:HTH-type transcriptional regulator / antitoxin HigA
VILNLSPARSQYDVWLALARRAQWGNPEEVKESHPRASILKAGRVVFNIKGNDYRLVAGLQYQARVLVIRFFGSHAEYDRIDAGDSLMDPTLIVIDNDAELARARALVDRLMQSVNPADTPRLAAQARLIAAYEEKKWPPRAPSAAEVIRYLMDQHGLTRADLTPLLGPASRVNEILRGQKRLSLAMVQRLRARFGVPADLLLPPATKGSSRRSEKRAAA